MAEAQIIDGKTIAGKLRACVTEAVKRTQAEHGFTPGLDVVLVGEDPASQVYVRNKGLATEETGMRSLTHRLPADTGEEALLALIDRLNDDSQVDGILVQLPLPAQITTSKVLERVLPEKDVDGFHPINAGRLASGQPALTACTPVGCLILIKTVMPDLSGVNAVIVGRSNIVGKPMAQLLLAENATVTIAHSRTRDLPAVARGADILVAAVGRPELVKGDWIKPGAVVIDVGVNRVPAPDKGQDKTRLVGDVSFAEARQVAGAITPVPGGVGPMTIACLMLNTLRAAYLRRGLTPPPVESGL